MMCKWFIVKDNEMRTIKYIKIMLMIWYEINYVMIIKHAYNHKFMLLMTTYENLCFVYNDHTIMIW